MNAKRIAQLAPVALAAIILSPGLVDAKTADGASSQGVANGQEKRLAE